MDNDEKVTNEHSDFDVNALLASINSNLEEGLQTSTSQNEIKLEENNSNSPEKPKKEHSSPLRSETTENSKNDEPKVSETQKSNIFTIVRDTPEVVEDIDPLLKTLEKIKLTNSLLTNEECTSFSIDTHKIQNLYELIMKNYEKKLAKVGENQRRIFDVINKVKLNSQILQSTFMVKEMPYLKMKNSEKESKYKQIKMLDQDAEKSKFYLLSIIHRLESLEFNLDKLVDHNLKNKK